MIITKEPEIKCDVCEGLVAKEAKGTMFSGTLELDQFVIKSKNSTKVSEVCHSCLLEALTYTVPRLAVPVEPTPLFGRSGEDILPKGISAEYLKLIDTIKDEPPSERSATLHSVLYTSLKLASPSDLPFVRGIIKEQEDYYITRKLRNSSVEVQQYYAKYGKFSQSRTMKMMEFELPTSGVARYFEASGWVTKERTRGSRKRWVALSYGSIYCCARTNFLNELKAASLKEAV